MIIRLYSAALREVEALAVEVNARGADKAMVINVGTTLFWMQHADGKHVELP
jgi:hypothetical protein